MTSRPQLKASTVRERHPQASMIATKSRRSATSRYQFLASHTYRISSHWPHHPCTQATFMGLVYRTLRGKYMNAEAHALRIDRGCETLALWTPVAGTLAVDTAGLPSSRVFDQVISPHEIPSRFLNYDSVSCSRLEVWNPRGRACCFEFWNVSVSRVANL